MFKNVHFYHQHVKKAITAFGTIFSNININRIDGNDVTQQVLRVPLAYSTKQKFLSRIRTTIDERKDLTAILLPRMGFDIQSFQYDVARKVSPIQNNKAIVDGAPVTSVSRSFVSTPWNMTLSLYVYAKNQEDGLQILEQILPTFTPDYTVSVNAIPDMNIIQDVPIILQDVTVEDDFEGDFLTRRFVTHTLTFTLKTNLYGSNTSRSIIKQVHANIKDIVNTTSPYANYEAIANETTKLVTSESWLEDF